MSLRPPAVAGTFYPADPGTLTSVLRGYLLAAHADTDAPSPRAIIVPHAGYQFSAPVAAAAYARLAPLRGMVNRVVLLGPSHFVGFHGLAAPTADVNAFSSPLGEIPLDRPAIDALLRNFPFVDDRDDAHAREHSLEVQLPFLQHTLGEFALVPLVVGDTSPEETGAVLEHFWDQPGTLIVISSDLSHFHDYATARKHDRRTADAITALDFAHLTPHDACGCHPIQGLLRLARDHDLTPELLDLRNSGDTAGPRDRVVGYAAFTLS